MTATMTPADARRDKRSARRIDHPHLAERTAAGRAARSAAPRSSFGGWTPASGRPDPVGLLEAESAARVPELVPIRYGRMLVSPFTFYRGAAGIMAADLAPLPTAGLNVQLCGDAHLSNFGGFAAPDRRLVFDLNDFDETLPGPFEWDVARLAASVAVAGRARGSDRVERGAALRRCLASYREAMHEFAGMRDLDVWYARLDADEIMRRWGTTIGSEDKKAFRRTVAKARGKDSVRALSKLTHIKDGEVRITSVPPLIVPIRELFADQDREALEAALRGHYDEYRSTLEGSIRHLVEGFRVVDIARKVVGVGSVGTRAWIVLLLGRDDGDPLFLQMKEAESSVLEEHLGRSRFTAHGRRVVEGQRLMQAASDSFLGWFSAVGPDGVRRAFYVRQLWDQKGSAEVEAMTRARFEGYAEMCGWTLARAHARTGDRIALAAYLGNGRSFDRAMEDFAEAYADQSERDYEALQQAAQAGTIRVEHGV
jgi:uncharacterized protein (DUF2252 family)